jgi:integrase
MASFRKRNGVWQVQIRQTHQKSISRTFKTKSDARIWARMTEAKIDAGDLPTRQQELKRIKLKSLLRRYRDEVTPLKRSAKQETYRLNRLLELDIASVRLNKLSPQVMAKFRDQRLTNVGPQAVRHELAVIAHVLRIAAREWDIPIERNPVDIVRKPPMPKSRVRRLNKGEFLRILAACEHYEMKTMALLIQFAIETGMRRMEILKLNWSQINIDRKSIQISETKNGSVRTVPLSKLALTVVKGCQAASDGLVFNISESAHRYNWQRITCRADIDNLHFHDLRHEAISRFFEKGLSVAEVALISGHKDVRQLFRYTHLRAEDVAKKL